MPCGVVACNAAVWCASICSSCFPGKKLRSHALDIASRPVALVHRSKSPVASTSRCHRLQIGAWPNGSTGFAPLPTRDDYYLTSSPSGGGGKGDRQDDPTEVRKDHVVIHFHPGFCWVF